MGQEETRRAPPVRQPLAETIADFEVRGHDCMLGPDDGIHHFRSGPALI